MKKNLPILLVVITLLGAVLACGGSTDTGSSDANAIVGAWISDGDSNVAISFGDDGSYAIANNGELVGEGTYTFNGSTLTSTPSDGSGAASAKVTFSGNTMTMTDPDGTVTTWTRKQ